MDDGARRAAARALLETGAGDAATQRQLILEPPRDGQSPILAHAAASRITGGDRAAAPRLVAAVWPVLSALVEAGEARAVVLLCVLRAFLGGRMPQAAVSRHHLRAFPHLRPEDLALLYCVMFNADAFGANRDDVLGRYPDRASALGAGLGPSRILLLEWLSGRDYLDGPALEALRAAPPDRTGADCAADCAAIRTLALRHAPGGPAAGETEAFRALSAAIAADRPAPPRAAPGPRARLFGMRGWQALQAGRSLAAPALRLGRRPRVALCVSGQLRGYQKAWPSWRRHLLPGADVTVFVQAWRAIGRADAQPFRQTLPFAGRRFPDAWRAVAHSEGIETLRARHPTLFRVLRESAMAEADDLRALYGTPHVVLDDETEAPWAAMTNQDKMHAKLFAADAMARAAGDFDLCVRLRPDLPVRVRAFGWTDLLAAARSRPVIHAEKPHGLHYADLMMGDQFAVGTPETMAIYADTWTRFPLAAAAGLANCPPRLTGHVSLALTCWLHGIAVDRVPIGFGTLLEAAPMRSDEIAAALEADGARGPGADRLLDAVRADLRAP